MTPRKNKLLEQIEEDDSNEQRQGMNQGANHGGK